MIALDLDLWTLARVIALALFLLLVVRALRLGLNVLPMSAGRRQSLETAFPMVELLLSVLYAVSAVQLVFEEVPELAAVAVLGLLFGGLWVARLPILDLFTGVFLRTNGSVARGDRVQIDGLEGQVTDLGTRTLSVRTATGDVALVPYSRLAGQSVVRTPRTDGAYRHTFRVEGIEGVRVERLRRLVLLCHWSSVSSPPVITTDPAGNHEITVFALGADRGVEIEAFLRKALRT